MSNARQLFETLRDGGAGEVSRMIDANEPESVILDFKEKTKPDGAANLSDDDKRNYSKALSGFANAVGGVLVWGVEDKGQAARDAKPIKNTQQFVERLNSLLPNAVERAVDGVENVALLLGGAGDEGYVVTFVPESQYAPHRGEFAGQRYYQRVGESFIPMEHYQIEDMFGRRQRPQLVVVIPPSREVGRDRRFRLSLRNDGRTLAQFIGVDLDFPRNLVFEKTYDSFHGNSVRHREATGPAGEQLVHIAYRSRRDDPPIFPGEELAIWPNTQRGGLFSFRVSNDALFENDEKHVTIRVVIYADSCPPTEARFPWRRFVDR